MPTSPTDADEFVSAVKAAEVAAAGLAELIHCRKIADQAVRSDVLEDGLRDVYLTLLRVDAAITTATMAAVIDYQLVERGSSPEWTIPALSMPDSPSVSLVQRHLYTTALTSNTLHISSRAYVDLGPASALLNDVAGKLRDIENSI